MAKFCELCQGVNYHRATCPSVSGRYYRPGRTLECVRCGRSWPDDGLDDAGWCLDCQERGHLEWGICSTAALNILTLPGNYERLSPACRALVNDPVPF